MGRSGRIRPVGGKFTVTDWEILQIYQNKDWINRTTFYYNGSEVTNPFK